MGEITIRDVKVIPTAPRDINLVAVKVLTSEPDLYGVGCATFTQRSNTVVEAIEDYIKPLVIGKPVLNTEDMFQYLYGSSYWRNGPVLNNAISGIDEALWDIKGKIAGLPVYQLLGGKCRFGIAAYAHADGTTKEEAEENARKLVEQGYKYIRVQQNTYGGETLTDLPSGAPEGTYYDPKQYMKTTLTLFDHIRQKLGHDVELIHDVHERLSPIDAINFAREMEAFHLFFLEDLFSPEQLEWFSKVRRLSSVPLAMGELFNNPHEWKTLIVNQNIDFIRIHTSQIGGITAGKKMAVFCEPFGIRTAWHGPGDITPIGVAANIAIDISTPNFGIQEFDGFSEAECEVFPGCPEFRDGFLYPSEKPGLGIDINEKAAAKYPCRYHHNKWLWARLTDGTCVRA